MTYIIGNFLVISPIDERKVDNEFPVSMQLNIYARL